MRTNPDIFANNMKSLENRYPELAQRVKTTRIINYQLFQQEGCIPNVKHIILNRTWYVGNLMEYFENQWKGLNLSNVKYPVFLGMGLGYELQYFLNKYGQAFMVQGCIIIERDIEMFVCALNTTDLTQLIDKPEVHFFIGVPPQELYLSCRSFFRENIRDMLFCGTIYPIFSEVALSIDKIFYMTSMNKLLESIWDSIMNYGNCPEDSLIGLENMLDNIGEIASNPGINLLYNKFKDKPAIIVATGPSLKKNIHLLKGLEEKALVISVDASLKLLLDSGITPHLVTSLEREHAVQQFFDNIDPSLCKDTYMAACPVLFNHVYGSYNGPKIIVYRNFDHFKWLGVDKGILDIKLSASNMAFSIAKAVGCNPIILVGQDLAYGDDGATHATPVPFSSAGEQEFMVKGNYSELIRTNDGWFNFLKALEIDISEYQGTVFNCTEGGAYVSGTRVETLQDVIDSHILETFHPTEIIRESLTTFTEEQITKDLAHLRPLVEKTEEDLLSIIQLCNEGSKLSPELPMAELLSHRHTIQTVYIDTFQKFLMHVLQSYHLSFEMKYAISPQTPLEWYQFVGALTRICLNSLERAKSKIYQLSGE